MPDDCIICGKWPEKDRWALRDDHVLTAGRRTDLRRVPAQLLVSDCRTARQPEQTLGPLGIPRANFVNLKTPISIGGPGPNSQEQGWIARADSVNIE
jgi:hypothetical protein